MAHIPRHDEILSIISSRRSISVQELTDRLLVSEVTIRKDLTILEEMGYVIRTRGGARLAEDSRQKRSLQVRGQEHLAEKERIGVLARSLVHEGDTIYIDSGSTCRCLCLAVIGMNLRVLTNSIDGLTILADAPGISLFSIGGSYRKEAGSFIGPIAENNIRNFQIQTCFLGATGFTDDGTFASQNIIESQLKSRVIEVSERTVILADASKYGVNAFSVFARARDVDVLVTECGFPFQEKMQQLGIEVLCAEKKDQEE